MCGWFETRIRNVRATPCTVIRSQQIKGSGPFLREIQISTCSRHGFSGSSGLHHDLLAYLSHLTHDESEAYDIPPFRFSFYSIRVRGSHGHGGHMVACRYARLRSLARHSLSGRPPRRRPGPGPPRPLVAHSLGLGSSESSNLNRRLEPGSRRGVGPKAKLP